VAGTGSSLKVTDAATLRGDGTFNQDRYLIGDYYAAVLDGASAYPPLPEARDGGWYADLLAQAIQHAMTAAKPLADVVREAIADVAAQEGLAPGASPSSTVSITRWSDASVECYLLGDSTIVVSARGGTEALSDQRLSQIATQQRDAYRARLSAGSGYDQRHKQLLSEIQAEELRWRNRPHGYWIAEAEPFAADHAYERSFPRRDLTDILLATDGAAAIVDRLGLLDWPAALDLIRRRSCRALLRLAHEAEDDDPEGRQHPRSKSHDDKTALVVGT
jgi:hypothetical protein